MSMLALYRDDGPLAGWMLRRLRRREDKAPLAWLVPPLVRALEYAWVIAVTAVEDREAMPAAFAFLAVLAFHQYDIVYRYRQQRTAVPDWVRFVGLGWEGRMLLVAALALGNVLLAGLIAASVALGIVYVAETTAGWIRFGRGDAAVPAGDEDGLEQAE
jgi:Family of unknown function (DUF5941)